MGCTELHRAQHWLISLKTQVEEPLIPKEALGWAKQASQWLLGLEAGAQGRMCQGLLRNIAGDQVEDPELPLHFAVDVSVFCRQLGWSRVAHWNWYLIHIHVVYTEAEQHLWLWPGSEQWVLGESCCVLAAHGACWISKAQANRGFTVWD